MPVLRTDHCISKRSIMNLDLNSCSLGIELGSTRIKATLIGPDFKPVASSSHVWSDSIVEGYWSYSLDDVWEGIQDCYASLKKEVGAKYGQSLRRVRAIGISAMMHGYLAFDANGALLTPFRTWRNTTADEAAKSLSELFNFNIPQRWSISHLYQDVLDGKPYVSSIRQMTTLSGYVHYRLTGEKVLGIGDASGMFPIDYESLDYDESMADLFKAETKIDVREIFPKVLVAGEKAGYLTKEGASLLDRDGELEEGILFSPPEGDAGTGMVATSSVRVNTGNVSAGTSIFSMVVLDHPLSKMYRQIDIVSTPDGKPVAMVHCNNCTSDMNAWVGLIREAVSLMGGDDDMNHLFESLYKKSLEGSADCDGLSVYNYISGEPVTGFNDDGVPVFLRPSGSRLTLASFIRAHLYSAFTSLAYGMRILDAEDVRITRLMAHGGLFRVKEVAQRYLSAALNAPVCTMTTAGEGGPYGMALLASYCADGAEVDLPSYLDNQAFSDVTVEETIATEEEKLGFKAYLDRFLKCAEVENAAIKSFTR